MYLKKINLIKNSFSSDLFKTLKIFVLFQQGGFVFEIKIRVRISQRVYIFLCFKKTISLIEYFKQ